MRCNGKLFLSQFFPSNFRTNPACDVEGVRWFGVGPLTISGRKAAKSVLILGSKRIHIYPEAMQPGHRASLRHTSAEKQTLGKKKTVVSWLFVALYVVCSDDKL